MKTAAPAHCVSGNACATPADLFGALLARVQESAIFTDGKTFVDATPLRSATEIMADYHALRPDADALLAFVRANFTLPFTADGAAPRPAAVPLRDHIRALWPDLARGPRPAGANGSALPVDHPHVVPGGRFREIYYWDSFFTMLGLLRDGHVDLATGIVEILTDMIERHGHVPNGSRTYYLGRSQPPLYFMMVALLDDSTPDVAARRLAAMKREHAWWMLGEERLAPGDSALRVTRLSDGSILNRYWDCRTLPRDESWREDVVTAQESPRPAGQVYRDLRAAAESGWDFSSRWLDGERLSSIRTTTIAPVDLNAFLYGLESAIAAVGDADAPAFAKRAVRRRKALHDHLWDADGGYFADYDLTDERRRGVLSAATLVPLLTGVADQTQADATAQVVREHFLAPGGLRTTLMTSGEQWDRPNGWAPLQWIGVRGLQRYGHGELARVIAERWIATVDGTYARSGLLFEKYDIESPAVGAGGEYPPQIGFGWTNGVTADLIDDMPDRGGVDAIS